jgi:hypothetical protein
MFMQKETGETAVKQRKLDAIFPSASYLAYDNPKAVQITSAIGHMIALDYRPYSLVQGIDAGVGAKV